jgi:UDP:flavonoid glycosyltransferase YjiC (YdhE family)
MHQRPLHILISPLDWGLGHAARCIPVISQLIEAGHKVTIAGYGRSLILLQKEFPLLESLELQGFSPSYSRTGIMALHLFLLLPRFILSILNEHHNLKQLISQYHFDIIISDNRYGLWNKKTRSILITHQVMIKTPGWLRFAEYPLYLVSRLLISRFDECWIPDNKEIPGLSGDLSHRYPLPENAKFIGTLTRFAESEKSPGKILNDSKIVAIISGPEPQRSIFEELVTRQLSGLSDAAIIISGRPETVKSTIVNSNLTLWPHLTTTELNSVISSSSLVICRSGYSSIMDLQALGVKALFVPTPGQTEQMYLAELHQQAGTAMWKEQNALNLQDDIAEAIKYVGFKKNPLAQGLRNAIGNLGKK